MPLIQGTDTDRLATERRSLRQLVESLEHDREAGPDWLKAAWRRVFDRAIALGLQERKTPAGLDFATRRLICEIRDQCVYGTGVRPDRLGLEAQWLLLEVEQWPWDDIVRDAAPRFEQALAEGDLARADKVLSATAALIERQGDNTYESDDASIPGGTSWASYNMAVAFPVPHDDRTGGRMVGGNVGAFVEDTRRTGAPVGRPRRGSMDETTAERLLLERCGGRTIDELRASLARGKPRAATRETRAVLAAAVQEIASSHRATHAAIAKALGCGIRTVDRLARN